LNTPLSLSLAIQARNGDWESVLRRSVRPGDYLDAATYALDAAAVSFAKKNPFLQGSSDESRAAAAIETWEAAERRCFDTNFRMRSLSMSRFGPKWDFLMLVRKKLLNWLNYRSLDSDPSTIRRDGLFRDRAPTDAEMQQRARHGPGSTFSTQVRQPTAADKYSEKPAVTRNAIWHLADIVGTQWGEELASHYESSYVDCLEIVRGNRFATVPKTALTDRSIAIEPSINVYFQLALGACIRDRLRRNCGWDLDNASQIHRKMALKGSVDGSFATMDMSSASDTISLELVKVLLSGSRWLERLLDLRSDFTLKDGQWRLLEKFSSMGNGYTFELETLIFAAISSVCLELRGHVGELGVDLFVYGDDVIVPTDSYSLVQSALEFCGFEINTSKSFSEGSFRESCGGDFFCGVPVRGFYLKRELDEPDALFTCYNGTSKVIIQAGLPRRFLDWVLSRLPTHYRTIGGSVRLGDTVLHGIKPVVKWKGGVRWVKAVKWRTPRLVSWDPFSDRVRLACRLTGHGDTFGIYSRGEIRSGEVVWVSDS
jgi:hypothetical protein